MWSLQMHVYPGATSMTDTNHNINESHDKVRLTTKVKRGSGTRDQDEIKVDVRGDNAVETVAKLNKTLEELAESGTDTTLRTMQPEENND